MAELRHAQMRVSAIVERCNAYGLEMPRIARLNAMQRIIQNRFAPVKHFDPIYLLFDAISYFVKSFYYIFGTLLIGIVIISSIIGGVGSFRDLFLHEEISKFLLYWEGIDLHSERCTIEMANLVQDILRPPANCERCKNTMSVDRVFNITPKAFEQHYAYSGRPVVIIDGQKDWRASETFSFAFFKDLYKPESPALTNQHRYCQFFPYKTEFRNLQEVFNMSERRILMKEKPWYIGWSNCDSTAANTLREFYQRPYFLPKYSELSNIDWIFFGSPGYGAHLHVDHLGKPSWQAQIKGRKRWLLEPPPECYFECVSFDVIVNAGEIIVLDTNLWYHSTLILPGELSIAIGSEYD